MHISNIYFLFLFNIEIYVIFLTNLRVVTQTSHTCNKIIILDEIKIYCGYLGHGGFASVLKLSRRRTDLGCIIREITTIGKNA